MVTPEQLEGLRCVDKRGIRIELMLLFIHLDAFNALNEFLYTVRED